VREHAVNTIRTSQPQDSAAIAILVNRAFEVERSIVEQDAETTMSIDASRQLGPYLVAVTPAGEVVGCVQVLSSAFVRQLAVEPALQGQGYGSHLMLAAEQRLQAAGRTECYVSVLSARSELQAFYQRRGYVSTVETRQLSGDSRARVPCHLIKMKKALSPVG
jgi:predicted N-acetyltransferase YhbS